ncbi:MAG: hypothetical protein JW941_09650, partial [Candidatus Coatesbacteria bacterium]|nr:hypothetical protein [Candidatus Coatesbacteria bacterium]
MAHAYTPGLKVVERTVVRKRRILPLKGEVLVESGKAVKAEDVVAKTDLPGSVHPINVANILSIVPEDIEHNMLMKEGDAVKKDEPIATTKGIFGFFKSSCNAPADGTIENISKVTGQVLIRGVPIPVSVNAYVDGTVVEVIPSEGVVVETFGAFVQGIFGIGGEVCGDIKIVCDSPKDLMDKSAIPDDCRGKILVGGSLVTSDAIRRAIDLGAAGIVVGGLADQDLRDFLGYDIGVAITGSEQLGVTLVITEGFGKIDMANGTFQILKANEGKRASINGATQIRAGVLRPEVIIPADSAASKKSAAGRDSSIGLQVDSEIRVIRDPFFGRLGKVVSLPPE